MHITYAGRYKNNIGIACPAPYNTKEFSDFVSKFKFVISMENSREDTYITEKVIHGLRAKTIPVYWGSTRVNQYIRRRQGGIADDGIRSRVSNIKDIRSCCTEKIPLDIYRIQAFCNWRATRVQVNIGNPRLGEPRIMQYERTQNAIPTTEHMHFP